MEQHEYLIQLQSQLQSRSKLSRILLGISVFCIFFTIFANIAVLYEEILNIPGPVRLYLLRTGFYKFSLDVFINLLKENGNTAQLPLLLILYWGSFISTILAFLLFIISPLIRPSSYGKGLLQVMKLREAIILYDKKPTFFRKQTLLRKINKSDFSDLISPLPNDWFRKPLYQWLDPKTLDKKIYAILRALSRFKKTLRLALLKKQDTNSFLPVLDILETFFLSVGQRSAPALRQKRIKRNMKEQKEIDALVQFEKNLRPLIIKAELGTTHLGKGAALIDWFQGVVNLPFVRTAITIFAIATGVMIIGVVVFGIDTKTAFLTWFAVMFGSLLTNVFLRNR